MSYHLLLVDDEVHAVEGVRADLDLEKLGISHLFVAHNAKQAKDFFLRERIDIMLCDIEMPQGSGLDLLTWVREHQLRTVAIFLTSHADFKYAKEAIRLGSLDYLLKPVLRDHLKEALQKAQRQIDKNSEIDMANLSHQLWVKHHSLIIERFWQDLISHNIPSNPKAIHAQIEQHKLPITDNMLFLPVLIAVQSWNKEINRRDEKILEYALKNSAEDIITKSDTSGLFFTLDRGLLLGIITLGLSMKWDLEEVAASCRHFIESCNRYFYCGVSCYIGKSVKAHQMADTAAQLLQKNLNNVAFYNRVFFLDTVEVTDYNIAMPELNFWLSLLKTGTKDSVILEVENFLRQLVDGLLINAKSLYQFHQNFMQALYSYLHMEGIQAHQLFSDEQSMTISDKASRSVKDLVIWVHHAVEKAMNHAEVVKASDTVVQTVQRYITKYIDQDLSREAIAEMVFLNPDYLSRLFKKGTGYSISDYILKERIELAKVMLTQTNIPISSIANSVGYSNFSHFTRIFKKCIGLGPREYRSLVLADKSRETVT
ncbi:response regulator [Paenibacillus terreus]|uniref:Response regulator n=1 Tax=Paenibacillus terreus TaxID=1387834 RepID=A0ABV5BEG4_9BACL